MKSVSKFPTSVLDRCREQNKRHVNMERAFFNIMAREEPSGPFLELSIPRAIQGLNRERGDPYVARERETSGNGHRCLGISYD